jgi:hypothetical protein
MLSYGRASRIVVSPWNETVGRWKASVYPRVKKGVPHGTATTMYGRIQGTRRARVTEWSEKHGGALPTTPDQSAVGRNGKANCWSERRRSLSRIRPAAQIKSALLSGATARSADDATGDRKKSLGALELSAEQKRPVMHMLVQEYPVTQICGMWSSAYRSYYRWKVPTDEAAWQRGLVRLSYRSRCHLPSSRANNSCLHLLKWCC